MNALPTFLALSAGLLAAMSNATAQSYSIDRFAISGGGGSSTGGNFIVMGTIGQAEAGNMSGGNFRVTGGFWSVLGAIQTPGAPFLSIARSNASVVVSWPGLPNVFTLEESANTTNWTSVTTLPVTVGDEQRVTVAAPTGHRLFRLRKP